MKGITSGGKLSKGEAVGELKGKLPVSKGKYTEYDAGTAPTPKGFPKSNKFGRLPENGNGNGKNGEGRSA